MIANTHFTNTNNSNSHVSWAVNNLIYKLNDPFVKRLWIVKMYRWLYYFRGILFFFYCYFAIILIRNKLTLIILSPAWRPALAAAPPTISSLPFRFLTRHSIIDKNFLIKFQEVTFTLSQITCSFIIIIRCTSFTNWRDFYKFFTKLSYVEIQKSYENN